MNGVNVKLTLKENPFIFVDGWRKYKSNILEIFVGDFGKLTILVNYDNQPVVIQDVPLENIVDHNGSPFLSAYNLNLYIDANFQNTTSVVPGGSGDGSSYSGTTVRNITIAPADEYVVLVWDVALELLYPNGPGDLVLYERSGANITKSANQIFESLNGGSSYRFFVEGSGVTTYQIRIL